MKTKETSIENQLNDKVDGVKLKTTREQALAWWNNIKNHQEKQSLSDDYTKTSGTRAYQSLTGREIEEIWRKETFYTLEETKENIKNFKFNQKQFQKLDESLFKAYTDKLPHNEVGTMIGILSRRLNKLELTGVIEALKVTLNYK